MKSDREFIDGIYAKAAAYEEKKEEIKNKQTFLKKCSSWLKVHRMQVSFATGAAFCAIVLSVGLNQSTTDNINLNQKNTPDLIKSQRGVDDIGEPATFDYGFEISGLSATEITTNIFGSITALYEKDKNNFADIMVSDSNDLSIINNTITFLLPDDQTNIVTIGEEVIIKLVKENDVAYYTLNDFKENLYRLEEGNIEKVYTSINGNSIREDEIKE